MDLQRKHTFTMVHLGMLLGALQFQLEGGLSGWLKVQQLIKVAQPMSTMSLLGTTRLTCTAACLGSGQEKGPRSDFASEGALSA